MEKIKERTSKYEISVRPKGDSYYEARISTNFGGGISKRIQKGGKTQYDAVLNLLIELQTYITDLHSSNLLICKIDNIVSQRLIKSINDLGSISNDITQKALEIVNMIQTINAQIDNKINFQNNVVPFNNHQLVQLYVPANNASSTQFSTNLNTNQNVEKCILEDFAYEWLKYRFSLCKKTDENPKPKSQNTIDRNFEMLRDYILPYFKKRKILYLSQVTEELIEDLIHRNIKSQNTKHKCYLVLNMLFKFAIKHKKAISNPVENVDKPPERIITGEEEDNNYIEPDQIDFWLDLFEKENTDMCLLFETMILTRTKTRGSLWTEMESF